MPKEQPLRQHAQRIIGNGVWTGCKGKLDENNYHATIDRRSFIPLLFFGIGSFKMKVVIKAAAMALAAVGISSAAATPTSDHVGRTTEDAAGVARGTAPFGLSFEDLRVGPTGKVSPEVGSTELPVQMAENNGCRANTDCGK
jgi:hypothetical protein